MRCAPNANCDRREVDSQRIFGFSFSLSPSPDVPHLSFLLLSPSCAPRRARCLFFAQRRQKRRGRGSSQSERAERRYLKHMQRVQLRSGSPLDRERGAKSLGQWRLAFGCPESDSRRFMRPRRRRRRSTSTSSSSFSDSFFRIRILLPRLARSNLFVRLASSQPALEKRAFFRQECQAPKSTRNIRSSSVR